MSTCIYIYLCTRTLLYVHIPIFDLIPAVRAHFSAINICCHQNCQIVVEFNFFWGGGGGGRVECIHNIGCLSFFSHQTEIKSSNSKWDDLILSFSVLFFLQSVCLFLSAASLWSSLSLSLSFWVFVIPCLSVCLSLSLSVCVCLSLCLSLCLSVWLCLALSLKVLIFYLFCIYLSHLVYLSVRISSVYFWGGINTTSIYCEHSSALTTEYIFQVV